MSSVELHYLSISDQGFDTDLEEATNLLDVHEYERYSRFKNLHARDCFLQARRIVKVALANKLHCSPQDIRFSYTQTEKPYLSNTQAWQFNISHSHSTIVVAIAESPVGIDVEDVERCRKIWPSANEFLNEHVQKCVDMGKDETESATIFAEHWSCTESYIKLKGSAIYREKDRVKAELHSQFEGGSRYTFESTCFTLLEYSPVARISVAVADEFPEVNLLEWRTGKKQCYSPHVEIANLSSTLS